MSEQENIHFTDNFEEFQNEPTMFDDSDNFLDKEKELFSFINDKIKKIERYTTLDVPSMKFYEVNMLLSEYERILSALVALETFTEHEVQKIKEDFDMWFGEKYIFIRSRENTNSISAQKWLSTREIETLVKVENKKEYLQRRARVMMFETKQGFISRLKKSWEAQSYILSTISNNLQIEVSVLTRNN